MITQKEAGAGAAEASHGFSEDDGDEIEAEQLSESVESGHDPVERSDHFEGVIEVGEGVGFVLGEVGFGRMGEGVGESFDAEEAEGETGGQEGINESGGKGQHGPAGTGGAGGAEGELREVAQGPNRSGVAKAFLHGWHPGEPFAPERIGIGWVRHTFGSEAGEAGAGDPVVESQDPHPAVVRHVMQRGVVGRKRRGGIGRMQFGPAGDTGEVAVNGFGFREPIGNGVGEAEGAMQVTAGTGGIDEETGGDVERTGRV